MTLTQARKIVRDHARSAGDPSAYTDRQIDLAIQTIGQRFARETKFLHGTATIALAEGDEAVDFSAVTDFRPERLESARLTTVAEPLDVVDWNTLARRQVDQAADGAPEMIAFEDDDNCSVWPTPDQAYTLKARYWKPFTTWDAGAAGDAITLNLPDDVLPTILSRGAPAELQASDPEHGYAGSSFKVYLDFEQRMKGQGRPRVGTVTRAMQE